MNVILFLMKNNQNFHNFNLIDEKTCAKQKLKTKFP